MKCFSKILDSFLDVLICLDLDSFIIFELQLHSQEGVFFAMSHCHLSKLPFNSLHELCEYTFLEVAHEIIINIPSKVTAISLYHLQYCTLITCVDFESEIPQSSNIECVP